MMWSDFRRSESDLYGWLLYKHHRWRFLKANATERDRWRSRDYLVRKLRDLGVAPIKVVTEAAADVKRAASELNAAAEARDQLAKTTPEWSAANARVAAAATQLAAARAERDRASEISGLSTALLRELDYRNIPGDQATAIFRLMVDARSPALNAVLIPRLIDGLRGQNETVRLETRKTLVALQKADYPKVPLPDETVKWEPKKDETAADIDQHVRRCHEWWRTASSKYPLTPTTGPPHS